MLSGTEMNVHEEVYLNFDLTIEGLVRIRNRTDAP